MSWRGLPIFGLFLMLVGALMAAPLALALSEGDIQSAQAFGVSITLTAAAALLLTAVQAGRAGAGGARAEFLTLFAILIFAPAAAATPLVLLYPSVSAEAAWFEMVSNLTTTGASIFDRPGDLSPAVNLWRAIVAWLGGLVALVMAFALLAPRNLGGYEVRGADVRGGAVGRLRGLPAWAGGARREAAGDRIETAVSSVAPIYAGLTLCVAVLLTMAGQTPLKAAASAMSLISTSGVQVSNEGMFAETGALGEVLVVAFIILAASRHIYRAERTLGQRLTRFRGDPELRLLLIAVFGVTLWLFLRHFVGALDLTEDEGGGLIGPLSALWGGFFTALSFATTTGVPSESWEAARSWSGLGNPGLVLFALSIMGGGIASTAGGVKLLRAYALYKHGQREMERLVRPSSISGSGATKRGLRREGAQIAWVFLMLFMLALGLSMLALSLTGARFELALAAAVSALSNTGPLLEAAVPGASWLTSLSPEGRVVVAAAMILGRVETLVVIAMINPMNWR